MSTQSSLTPDLPIPQETFEQIARELSHADNAPAAFFKAWKRSVEITGYHLFGGKTEDAFIAAQTRWDMCPDLALIDDAISVMSSGERVFLAALVSFYNADAGGKLFKRVGVKGLADLGVLDLNRRTLIAKLILNYHGW